MNGSVHQLKVTLQEIQPTVWRRVHVPSTTTLYGLHAVLQVAMGWEDYHLWSFWIRGREYGPEERSPWGVTLGRLLPEAGATAGYTYDFGDHWQHTVEVEKVHRPAPHTAYPRCSAGRRACPPEDSGGPEGYYDTLKVLRSRKGWRYRELRENGLGKYDPAAFDLDFVNRELSDDPKDCRYQLPAPWSVPATEPTAPTAGQGVDHPQDDTAEETIPGPVHPLTLAADQAAQAVRDALQAVDVARANLAEALRQEQAATGVSANELAKRMNGAMSRPLVLKALDPNP